MRTMYVVSISSGRNSDLEAFSLYFSGVALHHSPFEEVLYQRPDTAVPLVLSSISVNIPVGL